MKTELGDIECLEALTQQLLFQALDELKMKNWNLATMAEKGEGDSPFSLCMRSIAGGPVSNLAQQQQKFGLAARQCARESRDPRDLFSHYLEQSKN